MLFNSNFASMLHVSQLFIYPVKSLAGIPVQQANLTDRGFEHDRRWMLVDEHNQFLTQRELAGMALIQPVIEPDGMLIRHKNNGDSIKIPFIQALGELFETQVWDDICLVQAVSAAADDWFSRHLGITCRLVYMPDNSRRKVDEQYAGNGEITSLSDGYPLLIAGQASMDDLNSRMEEALPIERFRPNIVFSGGTPYLEDQMRHFTISGIDFFGVKPCARCPIPTINQQTLEKGKEPLRTLAGYRRRDHKVYFGQNLLYKSFGTIKVGDAIEIVALAPADAFVFDQSASDVTSS